MRRPVAVVFDLDDTLADTAGTVLGPATSDALAAMIDAGLPASPAELAGEAARLRPRFAGTPLFQRLARHFEAPDPDACAEKALDAFFRTPRDGIRLRFDAPELLRRVEELGIPCFLLTFGDPPVQREKIRRLGIRSRFQEVTVVNLDVGPDKTSALRRILERNGLAPDRTWVVGDRPDGEIAAGNRLGCLTIRLRDGEYARVPARSAEEHADVEVRSLRELCRLL